MRKNATKAKRLKTADMDSLNVRVPRGLQAWYEDEGARQAIPVSSAALARFVLVEWAKAKGWKP